MTTGSRRSAQAVSIKVRDVGSPARYHAGCEPMPDWSHTVRALAWRLTLWVGASLVLVPGDGAAAQLPRRYDWWISVDALGTDEHPGRRMGRIDDLVYDQQVHRFPWSVGPWTCTYQWDLREIPDLPDSGYESLMVECNYGDAYVRGVNSAGIRDADRYVPIRNLFVLSRMAEDSDEWGVTVGGRLRRYRSPSGDSPER